MTTPTADVPLLREVIAQIDAEPDLWDQTYFTSTLRSYCGTTHCAGGWANVIKFGSMEKVEAELKRRDLTGEEELAQSVLGLTNEEAWDLFYGTISTPFRAMMLTHDEVQAVLADEAVVERWRTPERALERAAVQKVAERIAARAGETL